MTEYVIYLFMSLLAIAVALGVALLNTANPTLVQSIKPIVWGCFGLPTALLYSFIIYFIHDFIAEYYGKNPDILRSTIGILTGLLIVPFAIFEATFPQQGWIQAILMAGLLWCGVPILAMLFKALGKLINDAKRSSTPQ